MKPDTHEGRLRFRECYCYRAVETAPNVWQWQSVNAIEYELWCDGIVELLSVHGDEVSFVGDYTNLLVTQKHGPAYLGRVFFSAQELEAQRFWDQQLKAAA